MKSAILKITRYQLFRLYYGCMDFWPNNEAIFMVIYYLALCLFDVIFINPYLQVTSSI